MRPGSAGREVLSTELAPPPHAAACTAWASCESAKSFSTTAHAPALIAAPAKAGSACIVIATIGICAADRASAPMALSAEPARAHVQHEHVASALLQRAQRHLAGRVGLCHHVDARVVEQRPQACAHGAVGLDERHADGPRAHALTPGVRVERSGRGHVCTLAPARALADRGKPPPCSGKRLIRRGATGQRALTLRRVGG